MKKYLLFFSFSVLCSVALLAQPDAKKAMRSVFTLKTFAADGTLLGSSNGFYVGEKGEALSSYSPFRQAVRAVVIDSQGKEWPVECLLGANETYDVAKFRVAVKQSQPLSLASIPAAEGERLWMLPYNSNKKPELKSTNVLRTELFNSEHYYYTLDISAADEKAGAPLLNANGQVTGIMQLAAQQSSDKSNAVGAAFAFSLKITGLSINEPALRNSMLKKALPDQPEQAVLTLYVAKTAFDSLHYATIVDDFIAKFPQMADGYTAHAQLAFQGNRFNQAAHDMEQALKVADKPDDIHYQYAKMMFQKEVYKPGIPFSPWTLDRAADEADRAYLAQAVPIYLQLKAQIRYAQKQYAQAYDTYMQLCRLHQCTADVYYEASRCKLALGDSAASMALLDSAVATFSRPYLRDAAPYLFARAQAHIAAGNGHLAVGDLNEYEQLMSTQLTDNFYYLRYQIEMDSRLYQLALTDIEHAITKAPSQPLYYAEKASLLIRVGLYDDAVSTARQLIELDASLSDGYLMLGYAQCLKGNKTEGLRHLEKAKDMGDPQAESLINSVR